MVRVFDPISDFSKETHPLDMVLSDSTPEISPTFDKLHEIKINAV